MKSRFQYSPLKQLETSTYVMVKSMYPSIIPPKWILRDWQLCRLFYNVNILEIWKPYARICLMICNKYWKSSKRQKLNENWKRHCFLFEENIMQCQGITSANLKQNSFGFLSPHLKPFIFAYSFPTLVGLHKVSCYYHPEH